MRPTDLCNDDRKGDMSVKRINIDRGWSFSMGKPRWFLNEVPKTRIVDLPHDFTISTETYPEAPSGASSGYYNGDIGNYTKTLEIPAEWEGKKVFVEFDGVYKDATVSFGGHVAAEHPYGYTPFHADLSSLIQPGKSGDLSVVVNNSAQPNSRWYSGSGIYRHVDLLVGEPIHIAPWGIFAYTERVADGTAYIAVEITVKNDTTKAENVRVSAEMAGVSAKRALHIEAGASSVARLKLIVPEVKLWDIDSPNLYTVSAAVEDLGGNVLDTDTTEFGVRTISVDVKNGFLLNGRTIKLKGGCVHHDNGMLGAASFYDSEYRKFSLMKKGGFNAIRCAHNPPSRDMLKVCDELGMLVMDEAFDMWKMEKTAHDYHLHFNDWWKRDMDAFITRDRNHPCIIMWSTGNEIVERGGLSGGYELSRQLADHVRSLDPTRPVTNAVCSMWSGLTPEETEKLREERKKAAENGGTQNMSTPYMDEIWGKYTEAFAAPLDVMGYNYLDARYAADGERYPDRVICGTESFPLDIDIIWHEVKRLPYVIGDFTWTGFDYLGEAGIGKADYTEPGSPADANAGASHVSAYPWRLANDSDFDICGFERPQLHYRRIVWGSGETFIAARDPKNYGKIEHVSRWGWPICENHWNWDGCEGRMTTVDVYSAAEEVELLFNGKSVGKAPAGESNRFIAKFDLPYQPGTLTAVSYTGGKEVSRDEIKTAGKPAALKISSDVASLKADGQSLAFVVAELVDESGQRVPNAEALCTASVEGEGSLAAFGIARPATTENYTKASFTAYEGRVMAIVRAGWQSGSVKVCISAEGVGSACAELEVK